MARRRRGKRGTRVAPDPPRRDDAPPRRWGAYLAVSAVLAGAYVAVVPALLASADHPEDGPLAFTARRLAGEERLVPHGPTADQLLRREIDEWGRCDDDASEFVVVGGPVGDRAYVALYDVVDGDICSLTVRDAATGRDLGLGGSDMARVLKAGGAWEWAGPVNTASEVWLGFAAAAAGVVLGGFLTRRDVVLIAIRGGRSVVLRWTYCLLIGGATLALAFANIDVLALPDALGYVAVGLVDASWLWGFAGGTWLLSPSLRSDVPRKWGVLVGLRDRWRRRRRARPAVAPGGGAVQVAPGRPAVPKFRVRPTSELPHFGNVGGMPDVKRQLEETIGLLLAFADEAEDYRITFNGILLHGPPGTGKTFIAEAAAGEFGLAFVHVTAADLVSKYVGETARNVEAAFQTAAANIPSLLFFDEFDAIAGRRDDDANAEDRRAVAQLLTSLERHRQLRDLIVLAATNDLERLDPAVIRAGRFDRHVRIDLPDAAGREAILRARLGGRPTQQRLDLTEVVRRTEGCSAATLAALVESASLTAFREATTTGRNVRITSGHLLGAVQARGGRDRPTVEDWTWDRLVLPEAVKAELQQVQALVEDPQRARRYGVRPPSGMLLAGPPGTGKTTIARVLAAQARCSFYPVTVADLTSKWVGESEDTVARLFTRARENAPSIVFLDEIDAVAGRRSAGSAGYENRLVNQLLSEIDGLRGRGDVFVLAATNRPDVLDPALVRGGRLSRTVWIPLPDADGRRDLLRLHAARMPLAGDVDLDEIALLTDGWSGADLEALCQHAAVVAMTRAARRSSGETDLANVTRRDFWSAVETMQSARQSAAAGSLTRRDRVVPPPGLGGS